MEDHQDARHRICGPSRNNADNAERARACCGSSGRVLSTGDRRVCAQQKDTQAFTGNLPSHATTKAGAPRLQRKLENMLTKQLSRSRADSWIENTVSRMYAPKRTRDVSRSIGERRDPFPSLSTLLRPSVSQTSQKSAVVVLSIQGSGRSSSTFLTKIRPWCCMKMERVHGISSTSSPSAGDACTQASKSEISFSVIDRGAKLFQSTVDPDGHGIRGFPGDFRDFGGRQVVHEPHDEDAAVVLVDAAEFREDTVTINAVLPMFRVVDTRIEAVLLHLLERLLAFLARLIDDKVVGNPVEERAHVQNFLALCDVLPGTHERLLHKILAALAIKHAEIAVAEDRVRVLVVGCQEFLFSGSWQSHTRIVRNRTGVLHASGPSNTFFWRKYRSFA